MVNLVVSPHLTTKDDDFTDISQFNQETIDAINSPEHDGKVYDSVGEMFADVLDDKKWLNVK